MFVGFIKMLTCLTAMQYVTGHMIRLSTAITITCTQNNYNEASIMKYENTTSIQKNSSLGSENVYVQLSYQSRLLILFIITTFFLYRNSLILYSFVGEQNILNVTMYEMFLYQQMLINYLLFHLLPLSKRFLKKKQ